MVTQVPVDVTVTREGEVAVLKMSGTENRINTIFCQKWMEALDKVESWPNVKALVTTGSGKFYSNGLDLQYLGTLTKEKVEEFGQNFADLRRRILCFPMVTVAAINGHCFAGGLLIAMLHDYRVMHDGRGWACMNEIDLGTIFSPSLKAIMTTKFTPVMIRDVTLYGNRFPARAALKIGLIDKVADEGCAVPAAVEMAKALVKGRRFTRESLQNMKEDLYGHIVYNDWQLKSNL